MRNMHIVLAGCLAAALCAPARAGTIDPFETYSVYSLGNIGTANSRFQAAFYGTAGAAGSVYLSASYITPSDSSAYALHVGGDLNVQYSYTLGGKVEAGGNVLLNGGTVNGNVTAGGSISDFGWSGATINGAARAAGNVNFSSRVNVQSTQSGVAYTPAVNLQSVSAYYLGESAAMEAAPTTGSAINQYGALVFTAKSGLNVISVDQAALLNAWGFTITGPSDAVVVINVPNTTVNLDNTTWSYQGGISENSVLVNMPYATGLTLSQGNAVNIMAPLADTNFEQGTVNGFLVTGDLYGGGVVTGGLFDGGGYFDNSSAPEPATLVLLACGAMTLLGRRRRRMAM